MRNYSILAISLDTKLDTYSIDTIYAYIIYAYIEG